MNKTRLEAFSDGVIAIIITIMVLEMKVPHSVDFESLKSLSGIFFSYVLSFIYVGIYWNNHHHLFHIVHKVNGKILWANLHLLFWLSLFPFVSGLVGESNFNQISVMLYGVVLFMAGLAYFILVKTLIGKHGNDSKISTAVGKDLKGSISIIIYLVAIFISYLKSEFAFALYVLVALIWLIPDKRIENQQNE